MQTSPSQAGTWVDLWNLAKVPLLLVIGYLAREFLPKLYDYWLTRNKTVAEVHLSEAQARLALAETDTKQVLIIKQAMEALNAQKQELTELYGTAKQELGQLQGKYAALCTERETWQFNTARLVEVETKLEAYEKQTDLLKGSV